MLASPDFSKSHNDDVKQVVSSIAGTPVNEDKNLQKVESNVTFKEKYEANKKISPDKFFDQTPKDDRTITREQTKSQ